MSLPASLPVPARRVLHGLAGGALAVAALTFAPGAAHADGTLAVTTPYPSIETQPGSTVKLSFTVSSATPEVVDLALSDVPDGWTGTLRGGGFVIHSVTSAPATDSSAGSKVDLEVDVAPDAKPGDYPINLAATDDTGGEVDSQIMLVVADQVNAGVKLTADFPSLSGGPSDTFTYNLTVTNDTPESQTFTFDPSGPQGWTVSASPEAQSRAETVTVDAGSNSKISVNATAPDTAEEGNYEIDVLVTGESGASGQIALAAQVKGTPKLELATADTRLNVSGKANSEQRIPMVVANDGSAALQDVKLAGTAPSGWDVSFDPQSIASVQPGETAQVTAIVKPAADSVAGDYAMTVRASAGSLSSNVDLRYTVKGSTTLGFVAIGVIVVAVAALAGVFVKFGRR